MSTAANTLHLVEKDVDKAMESVEDYYTDIETNIDHVIEQVQGILANASDDPSLKSSIRDSIKPLAKQYSDKHKDLHGSISKIGKTIDKCFQADFGNVPIFELFDKPEKLKIIYMIICEDLYRQGRMSIAQKLIEETKLNDNDLFNIEKTILEEINMILENLRAKNLLPALDWCQRKREELNRTGSQLEFFLHKMRFVQLLQLGNFEEAKVYLANLRQYSIANGHCEQAVNELMGALLFAHRDLSKSPYKNLLEPHLWLQLSELFMQQAFQQVGLAQDSPLYVVMKIGFQALPALMRYVCRETTTSDLDDDICFCLVLSMPCRTRKSVISYPKMNCPLRSMSAKNIDTIAFLPVRFFGNKRPIRIHRWNLFAATSSRKMHWINYPSRINSNVHIAHWVSCSFRSVSHDGISVCFISEQSPSDARQLFFWIHPGRLLYASAFSFFRFSCVSRMKISRFSSSSFYMYRLNALSLSLSLLDLVDLRIQKCRGKSLIRWNTILRRTFVWRSSPIWKDEVVKFLETCFTVCSRDLKQAPRPVPTVTGTIHQLTRHSRQSPKQSRWLVWDLVLGKPCLYWFHELF